MSATTSFPVADILSHKLLIGFEARYFACASVLVYIPPSTTDRILADDARAENAVYPIALDSRSTLAHAFVYAYSAKRSVPKPLDTCEIYLDSQAFYVPLPRYTSCRPLQGETRKPRVRRSSWIRLGVNRSFDLALESS